jgi:hypothetical protein
MPPEGPTIEEVRHPQHDKLGSSNTAKEIPMYDLRTFAGWRVLIISIVLVLISQLQQRQRAWTMMMLASTK